MELLASVEECIDNHGTVAFQNESGLSVSHFLELLSFYLKSTFAIWNGCVFIQRNGVCIGSCIAPVLSDIFLAFHDKVLSGKLEGTKVGKIFRFVDDYLVLLDCDNEEIDSAVSFVLSTFKECLKPLVLTHEVPVNGAIRFLNLSLQLGHGHVCWIYEPRAKKPILPFSSAHSKLVKRGIVNLCFRNALFKSCPHRVKESFDTQAARLRHAGYPSYLLTTVAESLLKKGREETTQQARRVNKKVTVLLYLHKISHNLKKVGRRVGVDVVFSAPEKLSGLCRKVNSCPKEKQGCTKKHHAQFVNCVEAVVYSIPLSCGRRYVGQTGQCLNDRLREHKYNVSRVVSGHLGLHCRDCCCAPVFDKCEVISKNKDKLAREIIEAREIGRLGQNCVSIPSLSLSDKERSYLDKQ